MDIIVPIITIFIVIVVVILLVARFFTHYLDKKIEKEFHPQGTLISVSGGKIHYTQQGRGPALVLIHGLSGNGLNFSALAALLAEHYTVYCIDRPGSGHSIRDKGTSANFKTQSAMILEWMSEVGLKSAFLAGHSMGGGIALRMALDAPERVNAVTLLCPLTVPSSEAPGPLSSLYIPGVRLRKLVAKTIATPLRVKLGKRQVGEIFHPENVPADFSLKSGGALALHSYSFFHASSDIVASTGSLYKQFKKYSDISCPVGILFGEADAILKPITHMTYITTTLPHCTAKTLPGAGHMIPVTQPKACADFISQVNNHANEAQLSARA